MTENKTNEEYLHNLLLTHLKQIVELLEARVKWHHEAALEFRALPPSVQLEAMQYLINIVRKPNLGHKLADRQDLKLNNCRKIYFDKYTRRIVYEVDVEGMIRIWGIGDRADLKVYKDSDRRKKEK